MDGGFGYLDQSLLGGKRRRQMKGLPSPSEEGFTPEEIKKRKQMGEVDLGIAVPAGAKVALRAEAKEGYWGLGIGCTLTVPVAFEIGLCLRSH